MQILSEFYKDFNIIFLYITLKKMHKYIEIKQLIYFLTYFVSVQKYIKKNAFMTNTILFTKSLYTILFIFRFFYNTVCYIEHLADIQRFIQKIFNTGTGNKGLYMPYRLKQMTLTLAVKL